MLAEPHVDKASHTGVKCYAFIHMGIRKKSFIRACDGAISNLAYFARKCLNMVYDCHANGLDFYT